MTLPSWNVCGQEVVLNRRHYQDRRQLKTAVNAINGKHGRGAVLKASAGLAGERQQWTMRQSLKTPNCTTSWKDLPAARASECDGIV